MAKELDPKASQISRWLVEARGKESRAKAAARIGVAEKTLQRWEIGESTPAADDLMKAARAYGVSIATLELRQNGTDSSVPRGTISEASKPYGAIADDDDSWSPNPALVNKIPKRAYEVAMAYCRRLQSGGWPRDEIDEIERLMVDPRYAQANKRKGVELSVDDHIMLIDATWEAVKHTASALGRNV